MRSWPIGISAFVHIVLFSFLYWKQTSKPDLLVFTPLQIEIIENTSLPDLTEPAIGKNKNSFKERSTPQLFPSYSNMFKKIPTQIDEHFANDSSTSHFPEFDSAAGLSMAQLGSIRSLWNEVDKAIVDNPYLSEFGYTGTVILKFELTPQGQIADRTLRVDARNPILKVLALRALRKALRNENNELRLPSENILLTAQFSWSSYENCRRLKGTFRKSLSFCKYAENKLKDFSTKEKSLTYLSSLRYGFGALEEIEKYNREESRRKTNFDPFEEYRRDPDWTTGT